MTQALSISVCTQYALMKTGECCRSSDVTTQEHVCGGSVTCPRHGGREDGALHGARNDAPAPSPRIEREMRQTIDTTGDIYAQILCAEFTPAQCKE